VKTQVPLSASLAEAGIEHYGFLGRERLLAACSGLESGLASRLGLPEAGGAIAAALRYSEGPATPPPWAQAYPGPLAGLARFARADWYGELVSRLRAAASLLRSRLEDEGLESGPPKAWRWFSNSRFPERRLALEAGLGRQGRHGLLMLPRGGSAAVLGLLLIPRAVEGLLSSPQGQAEGPAGDRSEGRLELDADCASCGSCVAACPTGALAGDGTLRRELCLQHWSSIVGPLPPAIEAAWGRRLYGCDACQEACPRFKPDQGARTALGLLGPGLPASWLVQAPEAEIRSRLGGSVLAMKWIAVGALRRNAALGLGPG